MEKLIVDVLNAGIGLIQSGKEELDKTKANLEVAYKEISEKGAQDTSDAAVKLRELLDKVLSDIKEFSSVAGKNYEETRTKIIENYNKITEEIKNKMPEGQIEAVKAKINEVAESIKKSKGSAA
ncbi:MAG: chemotaxis protein [Leptospiraceae bacterium]|nr:chemotaxis protein [Leptospiraceae bacterium]MCP5497661.1 chemotaxis protein [Leptospiraceae bacterium]